MKLILNTDAEYKMSLNCKIAFGIISLNIINFAFNCSKQKKDKPTP
jgi:hypothetical protein